MIIRFSGYLQGLVSMCALTFIGGLHLVIKEKFGWICAIAVHMGFDAGLMVRYK